MSKPLDPNKIGIPVTCTVCGQRKQPVGRSAPLGAYLCDHECEGFDKEPLSGSLWPGESEADFGYSVGSVGTVIRT